MTKTSKIFFALSLGLLIVSYPILSLILIWVLLILLTVNRPSGPYQYYEYDNNAQRAGAVIPRSSKWTNADASAASIVF